MSDKGLILTLTVPFDWLVLINHSTLRDFLRLSPFALDVLVLMSNKGLILTPVNGISIPQKKKTLKLKFWVVFTHASKIWSHLNENWSSYLIMKWYRFFWNILYILVNIVFIISVYRYWWGCPLYTCTFEHASLIKNKEENYQKTSGYSCKTFKSRCIDCG